MPKSFKEQIHNSVQAAREQHGMSQQELATSVDVSRQTISAIEKGNYAPSVLLAMKIAHHFDLHVEDIFSYE